MRRKHFGRKGCARGRNKSDRRALGAVFGVDSQLHAGLVAIGIEADIRQEWLAAVLQVDRQRRRRNLAVNHAKLRRTAAPGLSDLNRDLTTLEPNIGEPPIVGRAVDHYVPARGSGTRNELDIRKRQAGIEIVPRPEDADVIRGEPRRRHIVLNARRDEPFAEVVDITVIERGTTGVVIQNDAGLAEMIVGILRRMFTTKQHRIERAPK